MASTWRPDAAATMAAMGPAVTTTTTTVVTTTTRKASRIAKLQGYVVRGATGIFRPTPPGNDVAVTKRSQIRLVRPTVAGRFVNRTASSALNAGGITSEPSATNWTSTLTDLLNGSSSGAATSAGNASTPHPFATSNWFAIELPEANFTCADDDSYGFAANGTCRNGTRADGTELGPKDYWALLLFLFPLLTVFGNVLVILSVYRERALQNATNYFIISLAIADLLVATLVMPFAVYAMVNGEWGLPAVVCDFYIAMDVTSSTSSIFNLVAISIDRYIAVTQPIKYARHKNHKRVWLTIGLVWLISAAIGSPIVLGLNHTPIRDPAMCMFYNYDFVIYSSLSSFYIPCIIMVVLYYQIFKAIRERAKKAVNSRKQAHNSHIMDNMAPHTKRLAETALGGPVLPGATSAGQQQQQQRGNNATATGPGAAPATISGSTPVDLGALPAAAALNATKHTLLGRAASKNNTSNNSSTNKRSLFDDDKTTEGSGSQDDDEDDDRDDDEPYGGSCSGFEADNGIAGYHHHHHHHLHDEQALPRDARLPCDFVLAAAKQSDPTVAAAAVSSAVLAPTAGCARKSSGYGSSVATNGANQQQKQQEEQQGPPSPPQASSDSLASGGGRRESQRNKTKRGNAGRSSSAGGDSVDKESKQHQSAGSRFTIYKVNKASRKKREKSSAKKERKATKTLAIVLGVFLICWVPFFTCNIMDAICSKLNRDCQPGVTAFLLTTWLGYVNSFINPVIYTIFNLEFRKAFKRILTCAD